VCECVCVRERERESFRAEDFGGEVGKGIVLDDTGGAGILPLPYSSLPVCVVKWGK